MSYSKRQRTKAIRRFKTSQLADKKFTKVNGKWKLVKDV